VVILNMMGFSMAGFSIQRLRLGTGEWPGTIILFRSSYYQLQFSIETCSNNVQ